MLAMTYRNIEVSYFQVLSSDIVEEKELMKKNLFQIFYNEIVETPVQLLKVFILLRNEMQLSVLVTGFN